MYMSDLAMIEDLVRSVHLAVLAICAFLVFGADLTAAKSAFRPLGESDFKRLHRHHSLLFKALAIFWLSGAFLIWRGTGFEMAEFSPKLVAKIMVVTLLTANALVIGHAALPYMERNKALTFGQFSVSVRMRLAACAALSSASWVAAFCLGSIAWLKTASVEELAMFLGPIYAVCLVGACTVAMLTALITQRDVSEDDDAAFDGAMGTFGPVVAIPGE